MDTNSKPGRTSFIVGWGFVLFGLLCLLSVTTKEFRIAIFGHKATATVDQVTGSGIIHLSFVTAEGKPASFKTNSTFGTKTKAGDTHSILYLPSDPSRAKISTLRQLWMPMMIALTFTVLLLAPGALILRWRSLHLAD